MPGPNYQNKGTTLHVDGADSGPVQATFNLSWPSGHQVDDICIAVIIDCGSGVPATPSGWNLVDGTTSGDGDVYLFWRRATSAAEAATTFTGTTGYYVSSGDRTVMLGRSVLIRGCETSGSPVDAYDKTTRGTTTSLSFPSVTTSVADCLILLAAGRGNDSAAAAFSAYTNANLSGITELEDLNFGSTIGIGGGGCIVVATKAAAGAAGTTSATVTSSSGGAITLALKGPAGAPVGSSKFLLFF